MQDKHDAGRKSSPPRAGADGVPCEAASGRLADLVALSLAHFSCDVHLSYLPPLWPVIKTLYGLNNTGIGTLTALLSVTGNFGQMFFGYLSDRLRLRRLVLIGVLLSTGFISTIGFVPSLAGLIVFLMMAALGVAVLHPRAAALATAWRPQQPAFGLAIFGAAGTLGYALGAVIGVRLYSRSDNLKGLLPSLVLGLAVAALVSILDPERGEQLKTPTFRLRRHLLPRLGRVAPVVAIIVFRTAAVVVFANFMPLLMRARGATLTTGGAAVFLFVAGTAIGSLVGGKLGAAVDERRLTIVTLLFAGPLLLLAATSSGPLTLVSLFLAGFMLRCADYVNIAQMQAMIPEGASMAAALGMGAAWGIAGLTAPLVGHLADVHGEASALAGGAVLPIIAALIALATASPSDAPGAAAPQ